MTSLEKEGYSWLLPLVSGNLEREYVRKVLRCKELRESLETTVVAKLRTGSLVAKGFDSRAPVDAPRVAIPADRWDVLTPNFEDSSASGGRLEISGILVSSANSADAPIGVSLPESSQANPRRLVVMRETSRVFLDGIETAIPTQPFNLLALLAKAVIDGAGFVSSHEIEREFKNRSAADLVRDLKNHLVADRSEHEHRRAWIQPRRRPTGYRLALSVHEVELR